MSEPTSVYTNANTSSGSSNNSDDSKAKLQVPQGNAPSLNDRLNTAYIDVPPEDKSMFASVTRTIVNIVRAFVTPKQMLGILRILKAVTLSFLVLTIAADLMYMCLLQWFSNGTIRSQVGGSRDFVIRVYGLVLAGLSISIEFDIHRVTKNFLGLKGFAPRGMLLFFVATLTKANPVATALAHAAGQSQNSNAYAVDDDVYGYGNVDDYSYKTQQEESELPYSAIAFQQVTSYVLGMCAFVYFSFGVLCFDRFTSKAFLSSNNPLVTTAIPQPNGTTHVDIPPMSTYHAPDESTAYADGSTYGGTTTVYDGGSTYASTYPDKSTCPADSTVYSDDSSVRQDP